MDGQYKGLETGIAVSVDGYYTGLETGTSLGFRYIQDLGGHCAGRNGLYRAWNECFSCVDITLYVGGHYV